MIKYCCMPSKACVIIVTLFWLFQGIYVILKIVPDLSEQVVLERITMISIIIIYGIITIGSLFGLFVIYFANTSRMLLVYSKISYGIVGCSFLGVNLLTICEMARDVSTALRDCQNMHQVQYYLTISEKCRSLSDSIQNIIYIAISLIVLSIYSLVVISAYARKRKDKEDAARFGGYQELKK